MGFYVGGILINTEDKKKYSLTIFRKGIMKPILNKI